MSQKEQILNYIRTHGSISDEDAAREFRCYRLSARIFDLRQDGIKIQTDMIRSKNGTIYGVYREVME